MKKVYLYIIAAATAALTVSCSEDFFDRYPTDSMQMETYMTIDEEVENVLFDAYYYLQTSSTDLILLNELATDGAYNRKKNNSQDHIMLNENSWDEQQSGISSGLWSSLYYMINRCNYVLSALDNCRIPENKTKFEGEAKLLRAYAYFNLVRLFGKLPITESVIINYKDLYGYPREEVSKVYTLIKGDLTTAIANLPLTDNSGRATKNAARAMAAEVEMTLGNFTAAEEYLQDIIDFATSNPDDLGLMDNPADVHSSANTLNKEIILAAQFHNGATKVTNYLMVRAIPNIVTPAGQMSYTGSNIGVNQGNGTMLMTWDLFNALKNDGGERFTNLVYNGVYEGETAVNPSAEVETIEIEGTHFAKIPATLKFYDMADIAGTSCNSSHDNIIYRYADVLLMMAECKNENEGYAAAAPYLNQVRTRADVAATTAASDAEMALAIENERFMELCFEGHRWFDLLRTGRLTEVMVAHYNKRTPGLSPILQADNNGMVVSDADAATGTPLKWRWENSNTQILFPIPYVQIQLVDWEQNDEYI